MKGDGPTTVRLVIVIELVMLVALFAYTVYLSRKARDYSTTIANFTEPELREFIQRQDASISGNQSAVDDLVYKLLTKRRGSVPIEQQYPELVRMVSDGASLSPEMKVARARQILGGELSGGTLALLVDAVDSYVNGTSTR